RAQGAAHRILYYHAYFQGWTCKVDVLRSTHHLPALPSPYITWLDEIPAIPPPSSSYRSFRLERSSELARATSVAAG
ncbi:hypothetical protein EV122DRAFT_213552, partial [Schizophyllum commune]